MWQASSQQQDIAIAELRAQIEELREGRRAKLERHKKIMTVLNRIVSSMRDGSWAIPPSELNLRLGEVDTQSINESPQGDGDDSEEPVGKRRKI